MAAVSYTFNLEPVSNSALQQSRAVSSASSEAATAAQFQSVQQSMPSASGAAHSVAASPACEGSCYIVGGDGPGLTTLSIGEEDGGTGDYLALPIVDGVAFMEPPVHSFASAGDFSVTTLSIGEEGGSIASAPAEIGASDMAMSQPSSGILDYVEQTTLESYAPYEPAFADGFETAAISESYGVMPLTMLCRSVG